MQICVLVYITDSTNKPQPNADVKFYTDITAPPTTVITTDGTGRSSIFLDPGTYRVRIVTGTQTVDVGNYVVKRAISHHFSGTEILNSVSPVESKRFRNTRYQHSEMYYNLILSQRANWRI